MLLDRAVVAVVQYYAVNLAYYWYHWILHQPWSGPLYRAHYIGHHKRDYPVATLRRDRYSALGGSGWFENGGELVFGVPVIGLIAAAFWLLTSETAVSLAAVVLWVLITGEIAHSSYHLNDEPEAHPDIPVWLHRWLVRLPFYRRFQKLHDIHHGKRDCNFGFSDFQMDRLFGTYCEDCPEYLAKARRLHRDAAKYTAAPGPAGPNYGPRIIRRLIPVLVAVALFTATYGRRWDTAAGDRMPLGGIRVRHNDETHALFSYCPTADPADAADAADPAGER
jgi:sterol desaturase/sphingolipid hydroxylase (fatty acid hydroxylase superfamily)